MHDETDDARQLAFLKTPPGDPGSGFTRYAAAMYFHRRGLISAGTLEAYRICAPIDGEDPHVLLHRLGLSSEVTEVCRSMGRLP